MIQHSMGRFEEAIASYDRAHALAPGLAQVRMLQAMLLLERATMCAASTATRRAGRRQTIRDPRRPFTQPLWLGKEDLRGKTILVYAEQGFGDTLQFHALCATGRRQRARA
jgi:hypothetical protein